MRVAPQSDDTRIRLVTGDKKRFMDLLLLADEQEDMIDEYLDRGDLLVMDDGTLAVAVCVVTNEGNGVFEVRNLAVRPDRQRHGYGQQMLRHVEAYYQGRARNLLVGTGDSIACVFGPAGRLMIQQRTSTKESWPNLWDLTGGSALKGETSQQAISRELSEEVGLHVDFSDQPPHASLTTSTAFIDIFLTDIPSIDLATLVLQEDEVQAVRWATLPEILTMISDGTFCPYHLSLIRLIFDVRCHPGELSGSYFSTEHETQLRLA